VDHSPYTSEFKDSLVGHALDGLNTSNATITSKEQKTCACM